MNRTKWIIMLMLAGLMIAPAGTVWAMDEANERPYIGVRLDPNPLPELLRKHLQLEENEGLLIINVQQDSPAHQVGLERDDIIVGFQSEKVFGYDDFVAEVHSSGVGTEVSLEIIHQGRRKTANLVLAPYTQTRKWVYPFHRDLNIPRSQDRIFYIDPDEERWRQIPFENIPENIYRLFQQKRVYRIENDDKNLEIIIEGDPRQDDVKVIVRDLDNDREYEIRADDIEDLPEKYRREVRDALSEAREGSGNFEFPDREVFVMKYMKDMTYSEIGEIMELPITTVQIRLVRARRMIYNRMTGKPTDKVPRT